MYGGDARRQLVEPPFHLESHRYQTVQAADLDRPPLGGSPTERLGRSRTRGRRTRSSTEYFGRRLADVQVRSGIRG